MGAATRLMFGGKMKRMAEKEVEIDNLHLAGYLLAKNIPIMRVARSGRMGVFYFRADKAETEIQSYITGKALVNPRAFASAIRELRRMTDEVISDGK